MRAPRLAYHKALPLAILACLTLLYGVFLTQGINLVTADLGRHLKNGAHFVQTLRVPQGNFYSYTHQDYPLVNHHWASGVVFYAVERIGGFPGIALFFIATSIAIFLIFFHAASRLGRFDIAAFSALLAIPLLTYRAEVRPELFSYLLAAIFFWILTGVARKTLSQKWLAALVPLTALWVNLHIYFFLAPLFITLFALDEIRAWYRSRTSDALRRVKIIAGILFLAGVALLLNPAGLEGALQPFTIFKNYGYRLLENQSVWFIARVLGSYPPNHYFFVAFGALAASWAAFAIQIMRRREEFRPLATTLISIFMGAIALFAVRNFTLFAYCAIPALTLHFSALFNGKRAPRYHYARLTFLLFALFAGLLALNPDYWKTKKFFTLGLLEKTNGAAEFFIRENLRGPIFNNYDIGGYLIYHLYPRERVFVDNRPEAYPVSFFEDTYIPMQESDEKWRETDGRFRFNTVIFYRRDLTPWAQKFMIARIQDAAWAPVYVDDYAIIFLKRNEANETIIKKFELPRNLFSIRS